MPPEPDALAGVEPAAAAAAPPAAPAAPADPAAAPAAPAREDALSGVSVPAADPPAAPAAPAAPEGGHDYSGLALSEGSKLDDAALASVTEFATEQGLSPDQAAAQLTREEGLAKGRADAMGEVTDGWLADAKKDPEIGGSDAKFAETAQNALSTLTKFFSPDFIEGIRELGWINHPDFLRGLDKIARASAEPAAVPAGKPTLHAGPQTKQQEREAKYPNSAEMDAHLDPA